MQYGFTRFYWIAVKHSGMQVWRSKTKEILMVSLPLSVITFFASWILGDTGARLALEIAIVTNAIWLGLFGVYHFIRFPWLMHRNHQVIREASEHHWGWGVLGMSLLVLMVAVGIAGALTLYANSQPKGQLIVGYVAPTQKDSEIVQLKERVKNLEERPPEVVTHTLPAPEQSPEVKIFPVAHDLRPGIPTMEYVMTTGKIRTPVEIVANCDFPISTGTSQIMTITGGASETRDSQRISANQIKLLTYSPAWSPASPLWVTIFFGGTVGRMPSCTFMVS